MEIIKKKIKRATTISGNAIVPDNSAVYNIKLLLTAKAIDFGIFDAVDDAEATGDDIQSVSNITVTGGATSRLNELRKRAPSGTISDKYFTTTNSLTDGVVVSESNEAIGLFVYYIGGIKYTDQIVDGETVTTFEFTSPGNTGSQYQNKPIIKDESKQGVALNSKTDNNVFIIREEIPVFENNYRLKDITGVNEFSFYGGGAYFNVINNT